MSPSTATASSQGSFRAAKPVCQHLQERASPCLGLAGGGARLFMLAAMGRPKHVARILLVEDDESFSVLVRAYLRAMAADDKPPLATLPYYSSVPKLDAVGTLAAAREQLAARHYDLLLLDLHLPDSSGIDTLRAIRGEGERLIIVMTADEDPELPKKALEHGAYDFVAKASMDQGELRRVVRLAILQAAAMSSLAASEARFRGLTHLIADVYWEQDEEYRFVSFNDRSVHQGQGVDLTTLIGKRRWELGYVNMTPTDWERHIAALQARQPFHDLELCRIVGGRQLWVSTSGEPVIDDQGRFRGYRGIGRDITSRKREEQLRALEQAVTRALAGAENPAEALRAVIRAICETEHWPCGRFFGVDEAANLLRCVQVWGIADAAVESFIARSRDKVYRRGEGLTGADPVRHRVGASSRAARASRAVSGFRDAAAGARRRHALAVDQRRACFRCRGPLQGLSRHRARHYRAQARRGAARCPGTLSDQDRAFRRGGARQPWRRRADRTSGALRARGTRRWRGGLPRARRDRAPGGRALCRWPGRRRAAQRACL